MAYTEKQILEKLVQFKNENGCYPKRMDLGKNGLPGKSTVYRKFGNIDRAIKKAEKFERRELDLEDEKVDNRKKIRGKEGIRCFICGNLISNYKQYFSSLRTILLIRFMKLLELSKDQNYLNDVKEYSDLILDGIHAVFGLNNKEVRDELEKRGFLERFEERHSDK